jgi:hypothetical protein
LNANGRPALRQRYIFRRDVQFVGNRRQNQDALRYASWKKLTMTRDAISGSFLPKEPGGPAAKLRLQQRIDSGSLTIERRGRDKYGHTVGRVC